MAGPPLIRFLKRAEELLGRASAAHVLFIGLAGLALFLLITVPLVSLMGDAQPGQPAPQRETAVDPASAEGGSSPAALAVSAAALEFLADLGVTREDFTTFSSAQVPGSSEPLRIWELALPHGQQAQGLAERLAATLVDPQHGVRAQVTVFDSKTAQVEVTIDDAATHNILISDLRAEIVPGEVVYGHNLRDIPPPPHLTQGPAKVAIIIDDIGYRPQIEAALLELPAQLTFAVLPQSPYGREFAQRAHDQGRCLLLHLPLEPLDRANNNPGPGALFAAMDDEQIKRIVEQDIESVPFIEGVNNHMGSRFTQEQRPMRTVLRLVQAHGLYFIDSLTTGRSLAFSEARSLGVPTARRDVFLDHVPSYEHVLGQLQRLGSQAKSRGYAVAIGHPYEVTLAALRKGLPELEAQGVVVVPIRDIVY
ncbi:MAG: divergent polysaccharide deacetylase family protein [Candidatus Alcyoniella australis]|nr:divergent polysaccharide deacetylase family protein [Candidatus Alcyoniella australis]